VSHLLQDLIKIIKTIFLKIKKMYILKKVKQLQLIVKKVIPHSKMSQKNVNTISDHNKLLIPKMLLTQI